MDFNTTISQIIILFIIMFIGAAAKRAKFIDEGMQNSLSVLLMQISLPALVLSSTNIKRTAEVLPNMISILTITFITYILTILICILTVKGLHFDQKTSAVFISLIVFGNEGSCPKISRSSGN
jgi:predicted permease